MFTIAACVHLTGITFYGIFASGDLQPWAEPTLEEQRAWDPVAASATKETSFVSSSIFRARSEIQFNSFRFRRTNLVRWACRLTTRSKSRTAPPNIIRSINNNNYNNRVRQLSIRARAIHSPIQHLFPAQYKRSPSSPTRLMHTCMEPSRIGAFSATTKQHTDTRIITS